MCKLVAFCLLFVLESVDCSIKWIAGMRMRERWKDVIKDAMCAVWRFERSGIHTYGSNYSEMWRRVERTWKVRKVQLID